MGRIRKLPDEVVRRIAAGEVLLRPVSAVKELLENSIDAHATAITVQLCEGGLRGLTVTDDGDGIHRDDLALLCERHATSKLHAVEDLQELATFGFRGEALASMSVAGRVGCVTRRRDGSAVADKACFVNGKMSGQVEQVAGNPGTTITVDDLFYTYPERRKLFLSRSAEEQSRVFELMCKYAVAFAGRVGFTLRKGDKLADLQTTSLMTVDDVLRVIHGNDLADNVLVVKGDLADTCKLHMIHSTPYYRRKEATVTVFINDRLVEHGELTRSVKQVYNQLILSNWHPWLFLHLHIHPTRLDANVSPTKHCVMLADSDAVVGFVRGELERSLTAAGKRKRVSLPAPSLGVAGVTGSTSGSTTTTACKTAPYKRLYSDHRDTKIDHFFSSPRTPDSSTVVLSSPVARPFVSAGATGATKGLSSANMVQSAAINTTQSENKDNVNPMSDDLLSITTHDNPFTSQLAQPTNSTITNPWDRESARLLRDRLQCGRGEEVTRVLKRHVMVGVGWKGERTFLQYETCLMAVNTRSLANHLFYSKMIADLGRLGTAALVTPVPVVEAIRSAIHHDMIMLDGTVDKDKMAAECCSLLMAKRDFFADYFSIGFHDNHLTTLPLLINEPAIPRRDMLGVLLFRLAVEVPWHLKSPSENPPEEHQIIDAVCEEIATAYSRLPFDSVPMNTGYIKNTLFPAIKSSPHGFPTSLATHGHIQLVTDLHTLYKQFDRC